MPNRTNDDTDKLIRRVKAFSPLSDPHRTLLEGSPVCTKIIDLESRLQYMSSAGQKQLKICNIEPLYGSNFPPDLYPESWREPVADHLERAKAGETSSLECPVLDTEGNEIWFDTTFVPGRDEDGLIQYIIVTSVNITERRRAEEALRASESRNRSLLEGSPVCTKIIDLDFRLQYMSSAGQKQLKICNIEPLYGSTFPPDLYPEIWRAPVTEHLKRARSGETTHLECPVLDTEGNEVWYDTTFAPARDENGSIQYIIVTSVNITERRRAEEEARHHRDELAHVSRISTMGELTTGIAHELNQPLAAIASYNFAAAATVKEMPLDTTELQQILGKMEDQTIRAGEIVRRLRDFVNKTESVRIWADLNALLQDVAKFIEPDVRQAGATLKLTLDESSPRALVDKIQIQQVVVNLIKNALDAMEGTPASQRAVTVSTRILRSGEAEVIVRDHGKGLTQDEMDQIFNSFFSTKQEGMGMGLPISRSIVESHGGKLWSKSNAGPGATFGFSIPLELMHATDESPSVFIVDDESAMRDSLKILVQTMGHSVKCFSSAVEFLDVVELYDLSGPVCLIADIQMLKINGIEMIEQLNKMNIRIPFIMITGHGTDVLRRRVEELGAMAFLEKPFRPAQIISLVKSCLEKNVDAAESD